MPPNEIRNLYDLYTNFFWHVKNVIVAFFILSLTVAPVQFLSLYETQILNLPMWYDARFWFLVNKISSVYNEYSGEWPRCTFSYHILGAHSWHICILKASPEKIAQHLDQYSVSSLEQNWIRHVRSWSSIWFKWAACLFHHFCRHAILLLLGIPDFRYRFLKNLVRPRAYAEELSILFQGD